jgi:hypothetical protein
MKPDFLAAFERPEFNPQICDIFNVTSKVFLKSHGI